MTDSNINRILIALRQVIRATDLHSRHLVKSTGLTAPQLLLLQTVAHHDTISVGALARAMSLSQATVTTIIDRLVQRNLLARSKSAQDKRRVDIRLTAEGHEAINGAPVPLQQSFVTRFQCLDDWEQTMLVAALQKVAHMMEADRIDAAPVLTSGTLSSESILSETEEVSAVPGKNPA